MRSKQYQWVLIVLSVHLVGGCTPVHFVAQKVTVSISDAHTGMPVVGARLSHWDSQEFYGPANYESREASFPDHFKDVARTTDAQGEATVALHSDSRCQELPIIWPRCGPPYPSLKGKAYNFRVETDLAEETLMVTIASGELQTGQFYVLRVLAVDEPFHVE